MPHDKPVLLDLDRARGIARIAFNRPAVLNAIDVPTATAFLAATREATASSDVRCIVLSGRGRAFVAGGDVARFADDFAQSGTVVDALLDALHPAILALRSCPAPVVVAVRGVAAGAGLSLVLGADLAVAAEDARFLIAYDRVGAPPDCGGTWFLPRKVGRTKAFQLMLLGEPIDAQAAAALGIVNEVVPDGRLDARIDEIATRIAAGPTRAYGHFKRLIDGALGTPLEEHLERERAAFLSAAKTDDFREGVTAFLAKRKPSFRGS
jgi:2-(1,2-epoxy-1,2-dihydrophenyl)acetyl-CoA isomerase